MEFVSHDRDALNWNPDSVIATVSNISFELQEQLNPVLRAGDIGQCERTVAKRLGELPPSPFHAVLDLSISNPPQEVAAFFDRFCLKEEGRVKMAAAYAEMNGFDINPKRWYFSFFGFEEYGGHATYDWLADWQSADKSVITITGLEPLQEVYASAAFDDNMFVTACDLASLLVVIKFQDMVGRAAPHMERLRFPLLATAHEYDFIFEARPRF